MTPATTLQAYGFDSYPFHHLANRLCLPYPRVMRVVEALRNGDLIDPAMPGLLPGDYLKIVDAYVGELERRDGRGE